MPVFTTEWNNLDHVDGGNNGEYSSTSSRVLGSTVDDDGSRSGDGLSHIS